MTLSGVRFTVVHETGAATDVLVFGHSHIPWDSAAPSGLRLLNPGSPADRRRQPRCTFMTATVDDGRLADVKIHPL